MADNSSNSVAIVAIIIIILLAVVGFYYFMNQGGFQNTGTTTAPSNIEVNVPAGNNASQ